MEIDEICVPLDLGAGTLKQSLNGEVNFESVQFCREKRSSISTVCLRIVFSFCKTAPRKMRETEFNVT